MKRHQFTRTLITINETFADYKSHCIFKHTIEVATRDGCAIVEVALDRGAGMRETPVAVLPEAVTRNATREAGAGGFAVAVGVTTNTFGVATIGSRSNTSSTIKPFYAN